MSNYSYSLIWRVFARLLCEASPCNPPSNVAAASPRSLFLELLPITLTVFVAFLTLKEGVTTGVSAFDRVTAIRAAIAPGARAGDIVTPGHVFPLAARAGGVLARRGHTEGWVALAVLAGLRPAAVLCELMNADGSMMRGAQIERFAADRALPVLSVADTAAWRGGVEYGFFRLPARPVNRVGLLPPLAPAGLSRPARRRVRAATTPPARPGRPGCARSTWPGTGPCRPLRPTACCPCPWSAPARVRRS